MIMRKSNHKKEEFIDTFFAKCWLFGQRLTFVKKNFLKRIKKKYFIVWAKLGYDSCPYLISLNLKNVNDLGIRILLVKNN
jgi:hypothetical protein